MENLEGILIIFAAIVLLVCMIFLITMIKNNALIDLLYRIDEANKLIDASIRKKYDDLIRIVNIIEKKIKINSKKINEIKKINIDGFDKIEIDNILEEVYKEIKEISSDYSKLNSTKSFNGLLEDLNNNEIHLISLRTFYNKNVAEYNNKLKTFPSNIIAKLKKYNFKVFYEGKELDEIK
jgi:LemA protein